VDVCTESAIAVCAPQAFRVLIGYEIAGANGSLASQEEPPLVAHLGCLRPSITLATTTHNEGLGNTLSARNDLDSRGTVLPAIGFIRDSPLRVSGGVPSRQTNSSEDRDAVCKHSSQPSERGGFGFKSTLLL